MPEKVVTDGESRRLIREDLGTNVLVEAGAGSGKTQMLAERMAEGVAAGVYQIEHLAAVTFTRKAASELRGRFHLALEKARSESRGSRSRGARIEHALGNLERFFAGTIHSFCARLLRERPVESGVSPGFTELDEVQDLELRQRVWRDFVTSTRTAGDRDMMKLLEADIKPKDLDSAFATICLNDDVTFPPGEAGCPDSKQALKSLEKYWSELQKHLPAVIARETTCGIQKAAREFSGQFHVQRYRLDRPSVIASLLKTWNVESKIVQKWWAENAAAKRRFKEIVTPLHEAFVERTVEPYLSQWRQYVYGLSVTLLTRARDHAGAERRRLNSLNYGDLLNLTAKVLRENAFVRRALQKKYRHLFVDEFQDTDPVQAEIVFLLAAQDGTASEPVLDWRQVALRPGALFVVGDPKQSIYRFRRADIDIYNIVRDRFSDPKTGRVLPLTMNFRAEPALCTWANSVFERQFPSEPTQYSPRFAALEPHRRRAEASGGRKAGNKGPTGIFTLSHTCDRDMLLEQDAAKIADYIRTEVDAGRRRFSDFLILTRKKRDRITPYATALEALNVPIEVSGAGAFGQSVEVAALTKLLRALSDPQDSLALIAVLRGPFFGISDPELFAYNQAGGWFSIFAKADETAVSVESQPPAIEVSGDGAPGSTVRDALRALYRYWRWTRLLPAAAALDRLLEHSGYLAFAATTPGGVEAGDLVHAMDRVRQVVEEGGSLADAADALEEDAEALNEVESLPLEPGRTDVVRVMNLHKAKGLEAEIVFLADPNGGFTPRVDVHIERRGLQACGWFEITRKREGQSWGGTVLGHHADWETHKAAELPYLEAEEKRLLYVAATRAKRMLVVSRWTGDGRKTPAWGVLNDFLGTAKELPVLASVPIARTEPLDTTAAIQAADDAARVSAHTTVREPTWSITSVTAEASHIARMSRSVDAAADDPTRVVGTSTPTHRADAGMAWGTLIHGLLEHAMRHPSATRDDLRRVAMWLTVEEPKLRTVIDEALDTVARIARAEFWQLAQRHEHSVESPFVVSESGRLTNGLIDLLFRSGDGWRVLDYKTDVELDGKKYEAQLEAYRAALRKVGCEVAGSAVVHVRPGG
jgi:ATP-dependent helicase/nuclease subunit A